MPSSADQTGHLLLDFGSGDGWLLGFIIGDHRLPGRAPVVPTR
jgi:hypothetical protein